MPASFSAFTRVPIDGSTLRARYLKPDLLANLGE